VAYLLKKHSRFIYKTEFRELFDKLLFFVFSNYDLDLCFDDIIGSLAMNLTRGLFEQPIDNAKSQFVDFQIHTFLRINR